MSVKRLNYFTHQFLREQDFKDEQKYHIEMRRRHNRVLHSWGVAEGLEVHRKDERGITINPGIAIDSEGREIVLLHPVTHDLSSFNRDSDTYVTIGYNETIDEADHQTIGGVEGYGRTTEAPEILERKRPPQQDGAVVTLAKVHLNDLGHVHHIDMGPSVRKLVKRNPYLGWVRLAFKPIRLNPIRIDKKLVRVVSEVQADEYEFIVDEATAYCDAGGARGSMEILVPPGAKRVVAFRIAGTTSGKITVRLLRTGWNLREAKGEKTELLERSINTPNFSDEIPIADGTLEETHTLAVAVYAVGESSIWLVAAKFE